MSLFTRANAYAPLSPAQRALLKFLEGLLFTGVVAALPLVIAAFTQTSVDWGIVARAALAAFITAILMTLLKYLRALGDPPLPTPPTP